MAEGLGKSPDFFDPWFKKECSSCIRGIHYLPRKNKKAAAYDKLDKKLVKLVTPEHCDSGFVTILSTFGYPGLQVEINGKYESIKPMKNKLVVNIGETL